jgi:hypothetical protein
MENLLINPKVVFFSLLVLVPFMEPRDKDGQVLEAFEQALLRQVQNLTDFSHVKLNHPQAFILYIGNLL